jgi:hypothetical protein
MNRERGLMPPSPTASSLTGMTSCERPSAHHRGPILLVHPRKGSRGDLSRSRVAGLETQFRLGPTTHQASRRRLTESRARTRGDASGKDRPTKAGRPRLIVALLLHRWRRRRHGARELRRHGHRVPVPNAHVHDHLRRDQAARLSARRDRLTCGAPSRRAGAPRASPAQRRTCRALATPRDAPRGAPGDSAGCEHRSSGRRSGLTGLKRAGGSSRRREAPSPPRARAVRSRPGRAG